LYNDITTVFHRGFGQVGSGLLFIRIAQPAVYIEDKPAGLVDTRLGQQDFEFNAVTLKLVPLEGGNVAYAAGGVNVAGG
jgi:hypothetical protein